VAMSTPMPRPAPVMNQIFLSVTVCHPLSVPQLKFYQVRANLTLCVVNATLLPRDAELLAFEAACGTTANARSMRSRPS
jgi:hypothetical protein